MNSSQKVLDFSENDSEQNKEKIIVSVNDVTGKAFSPMAKPETTATLGDIPTDFVLSEDRADYQRSGKTASLHSASNTSTAEATKATLS